MQQLDNRAMEVNRTAAAPRAGGWVGVDCNEEQDFCDGAKELNSLHPVSSLSSSVFSDYSDYNEWMELQEPLEGNDIQVFQDVLLPDNKDIGPDFLDDLENNSSFFPNVFSSKDLSIKQEIFDEKDKFFANTLSPFYSPPSTSSNHNSKITTIKLKKIKIPKKNSLQNDFQVCDNEILPTLSEPEKNQFFKSDIGFMETSPRARQSSFDIPFDLSEFSNELSCSYSDELDEEFLQVDGMDLDTLLVPNENDCSSKASSSILTLKEAINMDNADIILNDYLSPSRSSISSASHQELSLNLSLDENALSPDSSQFSLEENPPSPANSSQFSFEENVFSPANSSQFLEENALSPSDYSQYSFSDNILSPLALEDYSPDAEVLMKMHPNCKEDFSSQNEKNSSKRGRKPRQKMTPESRYLRKKEQNKQAAIRYRQKKKVEDEQLLQTLKDEEERNAKLKKKFNNLIQETKFMKKLFRESLIARNLVPPNAFK